MAILTNKIDLHFSYIELDKASKYLAEVLNLQAIYKAEPEIKPEWAKKYKLVWNDETHRWNKPDSQEDASEAILEEHEIQVGENYVIGPKAHNKKLIGHEVKILGLKGDDIVIFDLDGKKGQMYKKNLEKWLEEDIIEEISDYYDEDEDEEEFTYPENYEELLGGKKEDDPLWEDPDKPKFEIGTKVIITNSTMGFMQDYLGQSGTISGGDEDAWQVQLPNGK